MLLNGLLSYFWKKNEEASAVGSEKLMSIDSTCILGFAGHRARDPPDPVPNSEVKPCSVPGCSVVFGHANPGKLAAPPSKSAY
jgi:hypothetical protein